MTSNLKDGCPRVSTEIMNSNTPLIIRDQTRLLNFYKQSGVIEFNDNNIYDILNKTLFENCNLNKKKNGELSFDLICQKNINL